MKVGIYTATSLFILGVLLGLAQLWFTLWSADTFVKIEITLAAFFVITAVVLFIIREYRQDKDTRSSKKLD